VTAALAGRISNREGAAALQLTLRQFQRLKQRFRVGGAPALRHQGRGQPSRRRLAPPVAATVQALLRDRYAGFNDTHFTEKLRELHGLTISRESVRRLRRALGVAAVRRRRPAQHRARRPREQAAGQLVQLDGSPFAWLEDRGPTLTLLGAIDDATSQVLALHFRPTEDLHGYATLLAHVCTTAGLPVALYGDGLSVLVRTDRHWSLEEQLAGAQAPTHFGRLLQDLGIGYIRAHSPQAKGRVERLWATLQDRLVSELRLRRIPSRDAANAFLPEFLIDFNRRFARPAAAAPVWRRPPGELPALLSCRYWRQVARDNTVRLGPRCVQIPRGPRGRSYAGRRVEVRECLDGRVLVFADARLIAHAPPPPGEFILAPRRAPSAERRRPRRSRALRSPLPAAVAELHAALHPSPQPGRRPSADHPWQRPFKPTSTPRPRAGG
jgi:transposase